MKNENLFSRQQLQEYYIQHNGTIPSIRDKILTAEELIRLAIQHKGQEYSDALYEELASHPNADEHLHKELLMLSKPWQAVVSAIATSGLASTDILNNILERGVDKDDELHVRLALFSNRLKQANLIDFDQLVMSIAGDDDFSVSARYLLTFNVHTPHYILTILTNDKFEHIAKSARDRLVSGNTLK